MSLKFEVILSPKAEGQMEALAKDASKKAIAKAVVKSLRYMKENLRHRSLNTHKYDEMVGPHGEEVFESYAQNNTPGAYRIFWYYGPGKRAIVTVIAIVPHP